MNMKKITLIALLLGWLVSSASPVLAEEWENDFETLVDARTAAPFVHAKALAEEISILNLVNGLYLSREQMTGIITLSERSRDLIREALKDCREDGLAFEKVLGELKKTLLRPDSAIPRDLEQRVNRIEKKIKQAKARVHKEIKAAEDGLLALLSEGQLEVVKAFSSCLIPPHDLKDPLRVGQEGGELADLEMHLDHLRNMSKNAYRVLIDPLLDQMLEEWDAHFHFSAEDRTREHARLRKIADYARGLSDPAFHLKKADLSREIMARFDEVHEKSNEITKFFASMGALSKTGKWLLNPRIIPILEEKLRGRVDDLSTCGLDGRKAPACDGPGACSSGSLSDPEAGLCRCGQPTFGWFCSQFGIESQKRETCRELLARAQIKLFDLLSLETADGEVPLVLLITQPEKLSEVLSWKIPGQFGTFGNQATLITMELRANLKKQMDRSNARIFDHSDIDLFEIHVGNLNRYQ